MKIVIQDMVGHPFQFQLARSLARRGHSVLFLTLAGFESPNHCYSGQLIRENGFSQEPVRLRHGFRKYAYVNRVFDELAYVKEVGRRITAFGADLVISAVGSPLIQFLLQRLCRRHAMAFVIWVQDLYGVGLTKVLSRVNSPVGRLVGGGIAYAERRVIQSADLAILICEEFRTELGLIGEGCLKQAVVIPNWAPIDDIVVQPRRNPWAQAHGLETRCVLMYSGTLGLKHHPAVLLALAKRLKAEGDACVVVISQGLGRTWLNERKRSLEVDNLLLFDYQPLSCYSAVLASADILLATSDAEASDYCVPSKVLSYLCAGRPILATLPKTNASARVVTESGGGIVVDPSDPAEFISAALALISAPALRRKLGGQGRTYAITHFDIEAIGTKFERAWAPLVRKAIEPVGSSVAR